MYDTHEQAVRRLHNSVIRVNGRPVYVVDVGMTGSNITIIHHDIGGDRDALITTRIDDPSVDIRPVPLGMMNYTAAGCAYVSRLPVNSGVQGLTNNNSQAVSLNALFASGNAGRAFNTLDRSFQPALRDMVQGTYPRLADAVRSVTAPLRNRVNNRAVGISREFALFVDNWGMMFLIYKTLKIGYSENNGETFRLLPHYAFLSELLNTTHPELVIENAIPLRAAS